MRTEPNARCSSRSRSPGLATAAGLVLAAAISPAQGQERTACIGGVADAPSVYIDSSASEVTVVTTDGRRFSASRNLLLCPGDEVQTGATGRVAIRFDEKRTIIRLDGNSRTRVLSGGTGSADASLLSGILYFVSSVRRHFEVDTPYIVAGIDGTEALVAVQPANALAMAVVREGLVSAYDHAAGASKTLAVAGGEAAFRSATVPFQSAPIGSLPAPFRDLLIASDSAVDWAVYYPPIMFAGETTNLAVREAIQLLSSGDYDRAAAALAGAVSADPAATASLLAIIAMARNRLDEAERWSAEARAADPQFAPAHVATSYVRQGLGDLDGALEFALAAEKIAPTDPYVIARVAELQMTIGDRRAALLSAERSLEIARTPLALFVSGLARLSATQYAAAEALFNEAISLDPEAPLPRLGLGLAYIRQGKTAAGTWEIERAVIHDPRRASLRTWLGRAYFDEELAAKAREELRISKIEDPDDPTPYLFSAIERYAANRPIESLRELQEAEKRGRARRVLRSHAGLAEDTATRGAALGRIYDILGFEQLAINEGAIAVDTDPSNPGAHRFLAEAYRGRSGIDIGKSSELLRSQLLSPPSKTPVQPELAEAHLALLDTTGPTRVTFAEFAPLFDADGLRVDAYGLLGTQNTFGDEASLTMLGHGVSLSIGQFHHETDGFNDNNDVTHDVLDAVGTVALTPEFTLFGEYRLRKTRSGDRRVLFDPDTELSDTFRASFDRELIRLGFHAMPTVESDLLGLLSLGSLDTSSVEEFFPFTLTTDTGEEIVEGQVQYITEFGENNIQLGGSFSHVDGSELSGVISPFGNAFEETPVDSTQIAPYGYATLYWPERIQWTVGASVDHIDDVGFTATKFDPKVGVRVALTEDITLRAAYFRTLKRRLVADQTLEPTAVAGFPQFFDAINGTLTDRAGIGVDVRLTESLWIGAESTHADMDVPGDDGNDIEETRVAGYLNATLSDDLALAFSPSWEKATSDVLFVVKDLETVELPLLLSYFNESRVFGTIQGTFVSQRGADTGPAFQDDFFVLDASLGYRFPNQHGVFSVEAKNLLDSDFGFVERTLVPDFTSEPRFARARSVIARLSLRF